MRSIDFIYFHCIAITLLWIPAGIAKISLRLSERIHTLQREGKQTSLLGTVLTITFVIYFLLSPLVSLVLIDGSYATRFYTCFQGELCTWIIAKLFGLRRDRGRSEGVQIELVEFEDNANDLTDGRLTTVGQSDSKDVNLDPRPMVPVLVHNEKNTRICTQSKVETWV